MVGDLPMVDATSAPPRPVVEWESAVVVERPLDADLWPIDDVGLPVWPDERWAVDPVLSAWAIPDPLANAAPTPTVTALAP